MRAEYERPCKKRDEEACAEETETNDAGDGRHYRNVQLEAIDKGQKPKIFYISEAYRKKSCDDRHRGDAAEPCFHA
ncbi:hypothetical protein [Agrobacterium larrymoorei]|uniref:hypothetical protein n=1 Tax=Agrobacterium larrymoorei TaxID=160699 RepID=UPI00286AFB2E|nr:hypothetical protein [Agrobacterium larrymoorei]